MDLGATVCLPGTPDCKVCPIKLFCLAYQDGEPERLPLQTKKKPPKEIPLSVLLLRCEGRIFVTRRNEALLHGLYVFYLLEGIIDEESVQKHLTSVGLQPVFIKKLGQARHIFTHRLWQMHIYLVDVPTQKMPCKGEWLNLEELKNPPFPTAMRSPMEIAIRHLSESTSD